MTQCVCAVKINNACFECIRHNAHSCFQPWVPTHSDTEWSLVLITVDKLNCCFSQFITQSESIFNNVKLMQTRLTCSTCLFIKYFIIYHPPPQVHLKIPLHSIYTQYKCVCVKRKWYKATDVGENDRNHIWGWSTVMGSFYFPQPEGNMDLMAFKAWSDRVCVNGTIAWWQKTEWNKHKGEYYALQEKTL